MNVYEVSIIEGRKYVSTVARGVRYTLMRLGDGWFVGSHRLALGRRHIGGGKHYETLDAVRAGCKAFAALDVVDAL
jgi:hypothetical protein